MKSKRIYNIVSYQRPEQLIRCIDSIFDQSDIINVALNCYDTIPVELYDKKIRLFITDNSKGDAFKFLDLQNSNGYYFSCDDDLIYPKDYSRYMIEGVQKYKCEKIISLHGRSFSTFSIVSFYRSATKREYCLKEQKEDSIVQFGGTGVMCFHTALLKIPIDYFVYPNMADVFVGKYAKENNIETVALKHKEGYIIQQVTKDNIYSKTAMNDKRQTEITNNMFSKTPSKVINIVKRNPEDIECVILKAKFGKIGDHTFYNKNVAGVYEGMGYVKIIK